VGGRTVGYYNIAAISQHGLDVDLGYLQAGAGTFSYVMFFMTDSPLKNLESSNGWSIGSGPSVVVRDKGGAAASMTSTTLTQDVYAFPIAQQGETATIGFEGYPTRIAIHREFITERSDI
jgi:lipid-binding SYLF domain-containing protein